MGHIIKFILGTCKIDKNCTCTIKLIERENGVHLCQKSIEITRVTTGNLDIYG